MASVKLALETRKATVETNVIITKLVFYKLMLHMTEANISLKALVLSFASFKLYSDVPCFLLR